MSRIHVISPGFLTTVQDLGRFGYAHFGISASGAADPLALRAGNLLVGNAANAPALEMTLTGGEFAFEGGAVIALTGSDFDSSVPSWQPVEIRSGETVRCGPARNGARCYLCVRGGLDVPLVMGSASVHVMTGVGGRPLRRGDMLPIGDRRGAPSSQAGPRSSGASGTVCLRATAGPQAHWFGDELYNSTLSRRRGIQSHGNPPARAGAALARRAHDHRRRTLGRRAGAARWTAHRAVRGTPDHRRVPRSRPT